MRSLCSCFRLVKLFSLQDPAVTDVAIAALNGLKMGDKTLSVRRASARFVFWCWLFVSLVSIAFVTILFKLEEMDNCVQYQCSIFPVPKCHKDDVDGYQFDSWKADSQVTVAWDGLSNQKLNCVWPTWSLSYTPVHVCVWLRWNVVTE